MKTIFGMQVDAWGAMVMGKGEIAQSVGQQALEIITARGLANLKISVGMLDLDKNPDSLPHVAPSIWDLPRVGQALGLWGQTPQAPRKGPGREHVIIQQQLEKGEVATVVLRIAPRGNQDLELSWRLFEKNPSREAMWGCSQTLLLWFGLGFVGASILLIPFGGMGICGMPIGLFLVKAGLGWGKSGNEQTTASSYQQFDGRALAQTVDFALMKALANCGVSGKEVKVLHQSHMTGLEDMGQATPLDGVNF